MIGAILFTDPADDGNITVANGYTAYPDGPARNPSSVQRGSVQFLSTYPGDPTTPGYPSIGEDIPRTGIEDVTPRIPFNSNIARRCSADLGCPEWLWPVGRGGRPGELDWRAWPPITLLAPLPALLSP